MITCALQVGQLKQHYLKSEILASCLAALDGLPPDHTMKDIAILARIACNIDVSPSPGGLLDRTSRMIRARDEDCKNKIRHYFWQVNVITYYRFLPSATANKSTDSISVMTASIHYNFCTLYGSSGHRIDNRCIYIMTVVCCQRTQTCFSVARECLCRQEYREICVFFSVLFRV